MDYGAQKGRGLYHMLRRRLFFLSKRLIKWCQHARQPNKRVQMRVSINNLNPRYQLHHLTLVNSTRKHIVQQNSARDWGKNGLNKKRYTFNCRIIIS